MMERGEVVAEGEEESSRHVEFVSVLSHRKIEIMHQCCIERHNNHCTLLRSVKISGNKSVGKRR
jgi:hypothetical protein